MKAKAKETKAPDRNTKPENQEALKKVKKAKKELEAYFKENKLDPTKDYTKDKKHGKKIKELMAIIEVNREKVKESTGPEKHHKKSEDKKPKAEKAKKLPADSRKVTKYDYPLVDGKEMTSEEKKKYRIKMRKEEGKGTKPEKEKKAKVEKAPVETKKTKKVEKSEGKKKVMKKKKVKKSDD